MKTTCIMCPIGCQLTITKKGDKISVTGNSCPRGERYGIDEITCPKRVVTTNFETEKAIYSVKTTSAIDKSRVFDVVKEIKKTKTNHNIGDIVISNIFNLASDVVVTGIINK